MGVVGGEWMDGAEGGEWWVRAEVDVGWIVCFVDVGSCSIAAANHRLRPLHKVAINCKLHFTDIVKLINAIHVDEPVSGACRVIDSTKNVPASTTSSSPMTVMTVMDVSVQ